VGFGTIGGFILLFFSLIIIVSTFVLIQGRMVETTSMTFNIQKERVENQLKTQIQILNVSYNITPNTTTTYIENIGSIKMDLEHLDVFVDSTIIPHRNDNRTIAFADGSTSINPLHWDPDEVIKVDIHLALINRTHILTVTTEYGTKDSTAFLG